MNSFNPMNMFQVTYLDEEEDLGNFYPSVTNELSELEAKVLSKR